jgi:hypothetical protein
MSKAPPKKMPLGKPFTGVNDPRRHKEGRPKLSPEVKRARKLNQQEFDTSVSRIISMQRKQLEALVASSEENVLDQLIGTIWLKGIKDSAKSELNYFVERFLGKVAETHNFQGNFHAGIMSWLDSRKELPNGKGKEKEVNEEDEDFDPV